MVNMADKGTDISCAKYDYKTENLGKHTREDHEKVRRFACLQCEKRFSYKQHLNDHVKYVHDKVKRIKNLACG